MAFSLHLEASQPCTNDHGYHEGYAYYTDDKGEIHHKLMDRKQAAGRQLLRLIYNAEQAIGGHVLSALSVVRFCEDHDDTQPRREHVRTAAISHAGVVASAPVEDLQFDQETGIGTYEKPGLGQGTLVVLPHFSKMTGPFNIALAKAPSGRRLYVAQQQGTVLEPDYVRMAPKP